MEALYRNIPGTSIRVSPLCLGTWQFGGTADKQDMTWGYVENQTSQAIVDKAIELGINFFDSAEGYSNHHAEEVLGQCLGNRRRDVIIATKFGAFGKDGPVAYSDVDIEKALEASLKALQTDYIDLYQVHWPVNMASPAEAVKALERAKSMGKIHHYAVSNFGLKNLDDFVAAGGKPVTNQLPYNLLCRAIEYDIMPACEKHGVGILAYSPLQQGLLSGRFKKAEDVPEGRRRTRHFKSDSTPLSRHGEAGMEAETFSTIDKLREVCTSADVSMAEASLAWLLAQPQVVSCIVGARTSEQVEQNATLPTLAQSVIRELTTATDNLKTAFGANADLWAAKSRIA